MRNQQSGSDQPSPCFAKCLLDRGFERSGIRAFADWSLRRGLRMAIHQNQQCAELLMFVPWPPGQKREKTQAELVSLKGDKRFRVRDDFRQL